MLDVLLWSAALAASLVALTRGADHFLAAGESVGLAFGLSPFLVGVTLLAIGTSLPELVASIAAVLSGDSEIAMGTAVGSNVTNILLVLSLAAIVGGGMQVAYELVRVDLPFLFGSALLLALFALDGAVGRLEALLALGALAIYLTYAARQPDEPRTTLGVAATEISTPEARISVRVWLKAAVSLVVIQLGAWATVESVVRLSELIGIGSDIIAASVIALGTSLPELSVSLQSARAGKAELAIGNVIGSNIFNALGVVGGAALFGAVRVPETMLYFALPAMLAATVLCFFVLQEREMTRWDGWLLLILYVSYTSHLYDLI